MQVTRTSDQVPHTRSWAGKYPQHVTPHFNNSKRIAMPDQTLNRSEDSPLVNHGSKLENIVGSIEGEGHPRAYSPHSHA